MIHAILQWLALGAIWYLVAGMVTAARLRLTPINPPASAWDRWWQSAAGRDVIKILGWPAILWVIWKTSQKG